MFYSRSLRFALAHTVMLTIGCAGVIVGSFFCYQALGSDLLPAMDERGFILDYLMPRVPLWRTRTASCCRRREILAKTEEVEGTSRRTGLELGLAAVYRKPTRGTSRSR